MLAALAFVLAAPVASARQLEHVQDRANLFPPRARARIEDAGRRLLEQQRVPISVLAIESLAAEGASGMSILEFADSLFVWPTGGFEMLDGQDWTSGIFLVRSTGDNAVTIRFGTGWEPGVREQLEQISTESMVPFFSRGQYAKGIVTAVEAWEQFLEAGDSPLPSTWERFVILQKASVKEFVNQLKDPSWQSGYFFPWIIAPFFLWELVRPWRKRQRHLRKGVWLDLFYTVFNQCLFWAFLGTAITGITSFVFNDALARFFGIENIVAIHLNQLPVWTRYLLLILVVDFWNYWIHRLLHQVDALWEFHKVHHSSRELDVMNAIRLHPVESLVYQFCAYVPVGMIGFAVGDAFAVSLFLNAFSYFTHANVHMPLGPLRYIFNNPQLHLWHHTTALKDRGNVNFGDALSMWDFIFGTGYSPANTRERPEIELGFEAIEEYPTTFLGQIVAPFRGIARSLRRGR